jgi:hypothetical protein
VVGETELALDDTVNKAAAFVVDRDEPLPGGGAGVEGDDTVVALATSVDYEARRDPFVHGTEVAHRRPSLVRRYAELDVLVDRSHVAIVHPPATGGSSVAADEPDRTAGRRRAAMGS